MIKTLMKFIFIKTKIRKETKIKIFNGVIDFYKHKPYEISLTVLGIPILKVFHYNNTKSIHIFSFYREIDFNCKNIIYIRSAIGEAYLLSVLLSNYCKYNKLSSKEIEVIGYMENYKELINLYNPNISYTKVNADIDKALYAFDGISYKIHDKNILMFTPKKLLYLWMFKFVEKVNTNYFSELIKLLGLSGKQLEQVMPIYNTECIKNAELILDKLKNKDNFIFLCPDCKTISKINTKFWNTLEGKLKALGFDILYNNKNIKLDELHYIVEHARGTVSMCCGLCESLTNTKGIFHILYTDMGFVKIPAPNVLKSHSAKYLPFVNPENIHEYIYMQENEEKIIDEIIKSFV